MKGISASFKYIHDRLEAREELKRQLEAANRLVRTTRQEYTREQILELRYNDLVDIANELQEYTAELNMYTNSRRFFGAKKNEEKLRRLTDRVQRALTQYHDAYLSFENPPAHPRRRVRRQERVAEPPKKKGFRHLLQESNGMLISYKPWK